MDTSPAENTSAAAAHDVSRLRSGGDAPDTTGYGLLASFDSLVQAGAATASSIAADIVPTGLGGRFIRTCT